MLRKFVRRLESPVGRQETIEKWKKIIATKEKSSNPLELTRGIWPDQYKPESSETLKKPLLLIDFERFTSKRHFRERISSGEAQSSFKSLETNIYAQILASPPRMEMLSRTILPSDLLIRLAIVKADDDNSYILTPLIYKDFVRGSGAYVTCSKKALTMLSGFRASSLLKRFHMEVDKKTVLRPNIVTFYDELMTDRILAEAKKISAPEPDAPYTLDHQYLSSFMSSEELNSFAQALDISFTENIKLNADAKDLLIMLHRQYLYRSE